MNFWEYVLHVHRTGDWQSLVLFWGPIVAFVLFVWLLLRLARSRRLASRAHEMMRDMLEEVRGLNEELTELERRMERRLDTRAGELDERMTKKLDKRSDLLQERIEERVGSLTDSISALDGRVTRADDQIDAFRAKLEDVEARIPNLFDKLEEFRGTLGRSFRAELSSVLNSFDNSLAAVLQQMKSDLEVGIDRIESIEGMVRSREQAEQSLLTTGEPPEVPAPSETEEEEFEEWEKEAKELAEGPEETALDEELTSMAEAPEEKPEAEEEIEDYPGELGEVPEPFEEEEEEEE